MTPTQQRHLLADVEAFCEELRPVEELCYVEHRFNDQVLPLAKKHNVLGMPVPEAYGGRGSDKIDGDAGADYIRGGAGLDFVQGGADDDDIGGGADDDTLNGNDGNDLVHGDGGNDVIWGEGGDVLIGEVSTVNDDVTDNVFVSKKIGRFSEIEEDVAPTHLLVSDYDRWLA